VVFALYRTYADWLQNMQKTYDIMSYRQDLPGFERINTDTKKGGNIYKRGYPKK